MAAVVGIGLGVAGGIALGNRFFGVVEGMKDFRFLEREADQDENVPDHPTTLVVQPEVRALLPYLPEWTLLPDFDQVLWLNSVLEWLWPHFTAGVEKMVKQTTGPVLKDVVKQQSAWLDALEIDVFDLGPMPAKLGGVKIYDTREDEVMIETPVLFGSNMKLHLSLWIRLGPLQLYVPIKAENVTLKATVRTTIRPLVDTLPCLGAVMVTLTESPYVDLVLKAVTDFDLMAVPGVHAAVLLAVKKLIEGICVFPNTIPIPIMPNSGLPKPPRGMLEIDVHRIDHLKGKGDLIGSGDPFVRMSYIHMDRQGKILRQGPAHETSIKSGRKPIYEEKLRLLVDDIGEGHYVLIEVIDFDVFSDDTMMCICNMPLDDSPSAEYSFLREARKNEEITVQLQPPPPKNGFGKAKLHRVLEVGHRPKADGSMGQLHLTCNFSPFHRRKEDAEYSDNPAAALEAYEARRTPKAVSEDMMGVLSVNLIRAANLPSSHDMCNPFVELKVTEPDGSEPDPIRTDVVPDEISPHFCFKYDFVFISVMSTLTVTVYNKRGIFEVSTVVKPWAKKEEMLGKVTIPVKEVARVSRLKDSFPLDDATSGDVVLALEWQVVERDDDPNDHVTRERRDEEFQPAPAIPASAPPQVDATVRVSVAPAPILVIPPNAAVGPQSYRLS